MRIADTGLWRGGFGLAAAVADELNSGEQQGEEAGGEASHGQHQREPAEIGVRALVTRDAAEAGEDERGGDGSGAEDEKAGAEELAGVWLHKEGASGRQRAWRRR